MLAWIFRRCEGTAEAVETPIGLVPPVGEGGIDIDGLDVSDETMAKLLEVDADGWQDQLPQMHEHYAEFGDKLPDELRGQLEALERAAASPSTASCTLEVEKSRGHRCGHVRWRHGACVHPSDAGLLALQAGMVAAPRAGLAASRRSSGCAAAAGRWSRSGRSSRVIFAIRYVSDTATGLTWLALIAVPLLAAVTLGWAMRGAKPLAALAGDPLFVLAWAAKDSLAGQAAAAILSALSCVTLGVLLAAVTPPALAEGRDPADGRR